VKHAFNATLAVLAIAAPALVGCAMMPVRPSETGASEPVKPSQDGSLVVYTQVEDRERAENELAMPERLPYSILDAEGRAIRRVENGGAAPDVVSLQSGTYVVRQMGDHPVEARVQIAQARTTTVRLDASSSAAPTGKFAQRSADVVAGRSN
jgi:hypothetical protein